MIFPFRPFPVHPSPAYPSPIIQRPVIPIWARAPGRSRVPFFGLLDTGSDDTKFPIAAADRLGVELDRSRPIVFRGVGGVARGYYGEVILELRQSPRSWVWSAQVAFLADPEGSDDEGIIVTLGHAGFFRYFHAAFDYQRGRARLRPNGLFVGLDPSE